MKLPAYVVVAAGLLATLGWTASRPAFAGSSATYDTLLAQGQSLEHEGESLAAFIDYYQASLLQTDGVDANSDLMRLLHSGLPMRIPQSVFGSADNGVNPLKVDLLLGGKLLAISPRVGEIAPIADPQNNWPFTRLTYFYRQSTKPAGDWECFAIAHSQTSDDQDLGVRMGRLLLVIRQALVEKTGHNALTDGKPFGIWLTRHAPDTAGGEMWQNNIYFYDVTAARSQIEWIREVAHEFSHLALPAIGGDYTEPEAWANGYYGERLLLRWLSRGAAGGSSAVEDAWGGTFAGYGNFDQAMIAPSLADFNAAGLNRAHLARRDGEGMKYMIGLLLALDDHAGGKALGDMLWDLPQTAQVDPLLLYSPAQEALAKPAIAQETPAVAAQPAVSTTAPSVPTKPVKPRPPAGGQPRAPSAPPEFAR